MALIFKETELSPEKEVILKLAWELGLAHRKADQIQKAKDTAWEQEKERREKEAREAWEAEQKPVVKRKRTKKEVK